MRDGLIMIIIQDQVRAEGFTSEGFLRVTSEKAFAEGWPEELILRQAGSGRNRRPIAILSSIYEHDASPQACTCPVARGAAAGILASCRLLPRETQTRFSRCRRGGLVSCCCEPIVFHHYCIGQNKHAQGTYSEKSYCFAARRPGENQRYVHCPPRILLFVLAKSSPHLRSPRDKRCLQSFRVQLKFQLVRCQTSLK